MISKKQLCWFDLRRYYLRFLLVIALIAVTPAPIPQVWAAPQTEDLITALQAHANGTLRIASHAGTGKVRFIGADFDQPIAKAAFAPSATNVTTAGEGARAFMKHYGTLFGLTDPTNELVVRQTNPSDRGRTFVRFQQVYQNIPIFGGEFMVQVDSNQNVISANGEALPDIAVATTPTIDATVAQQTALTAVAKWHSVDGTQLQTSTPELWIYNPILVSPYQGPTRLVWRLEVTPTTLLPIRELVLIDAQRGAVALHFNQVETAKNRRTYTANNSPTLPGTLVCDEANPTCTGGDPHAVAAHTYTGHTYDFFATQHGRDSLDGAGMPLTSTVHSCPTGSPCPYANAFWNGTQMVYGDRYGFPLADDVVAHELTHGVTEFSSNLFYYYQSGAINESFSDIWGEFVDLTNQAGNDSASVRWLIGEDVTGLDAFRNMQNPPAFGAPDKMTSPFYAIGNGDVPFNDNGGVHTNSGVNNKAAFLLTDGGTFNGQTITGLGIPKVAKIYYEAQTNLLTSGADYADLYELLYQACLNLVGTAGITTSDCLEVRKATIATEMSLQPTSGYNTEAPLCDNGASPATLFYDDLENGAGQWVTITLSGTNRWSYDSPYGPFAHSGVHFLYADDFPAVIADSSIAMRNGVPLPANAYLHFVHAYGFEDPNFDGGVVEYSTNNGASWQDADSLFEINGYDGTIPTLFNNPMKGRRAFLADSHGYISSRLNLASLANQTVRFRWRLGVDSSGFDFGWWLDDVRIYTCAVANPVAPTLSIARSGNNINLSWTDDPANQGYEVHRNLLPFFTPGASTLLTTLSATAATYTDAGPTGNPSQNYFYIVRATVGSQGANSNEVGEIDYALNNSGGKYNLIALPFPATTINNAASLASAIGNVTTLLKWNPTTQTFRLYNATTSAGDNFPVNTGDAIFVVLSSSGPSVFSQTGTVTAVQYTLKPSGYSFIALPPQRASLTTASGVAVNITHVTTLLAWNPATQAFRIYVPPTNAGDNFAVTPGTPFIVQLDASGPATWP